MVKIPDLLISSSKFGVSPVVEEINNLQVAGAALGAAGSVMDTIEERDADAYMADAETNLRLYGSEALVEAKNEAESPDQISNLFFEKYTKRKSDLINSAPNDKAVAKLDNLYNDLQARFGSAAINTQASEVQAFRINQLDRSADDLIVHVRNGGDYDFGVESLNSAIEKGSSFLSATALDERRFNKVADMKRARLDYLFEQGEVKEVTRLINDEQFNKELNSGDVSAYRSAVAKYKEEKQAKNDVAEYVAGSLPYLDITDSKNKKAADQIYTQFIQPDLLGDDPAKKQAAYAAAIQMANTGITPKSLTGYIKAAYVGQPGADKDMAYQFVSDLHNLNPRAAENIGLKDAEINEALLYMNLKDSGVPETEAMQVMRENIYPDNPMVLEARKAELKDITPDIDIEDLFDPGIFEPDIIDISGKKTAYENKYKELYDQFYLATGSENVAKTRADAAFTSGKMFGVSSITDDSGYITDYPPESYYEFDSKFLRKVLMEDIKANPEYKDLTYKDIRIVPDRTTVQAARNGVYPPYRIVKADTLDYITTYIWDVDKIKKRYQSELESKSQMRRKKQDSGIAYDYMMGIVAE